MPRKTKSLKPSIESASPDHALADIGQAAPGSSAAATVDRITSPPSGKLGLLIEQLEGTSGVAMPDLMAATGWKAHTVRAALSRLRARGFRIDLEDEGGQKVYRLLAEGGASC